MSRARMRRRRRRSRGGTRRPCAARSGGGRRRGRARGPLEREATRGEHALPPHSVAEGDRRIARDEQHRRGPLRPALDEVRPLPEVDAPELAIGAPEIEAGREREARSSSPPGSAYSPAARGARLDGPCRPEERAKRPEGRRMRSTDPATSSRWSCRDETGAAPVTGRPLARGGLVSPRPRGTARRRGPAEEPAESVEAVVPVVVARHAEEDARRHRPDSCSSSFHGRTRRL